MPQFGTTPRPSMVGGETTPFCGQGDGGGTIEPLALACSYCARRLAPSCLYCSIRIGFAEAMPAKLRIPHAAAATATIRIGRESTWFSFSEAGAVGHPPADWRPMTE